jgi:hypothetical protein
MRARQDFRPKRNFTVQEANRALVLVKRIVVDVIFGYSRLLDLQEALETAEAAGSLEQYEATRLGLIRSAGRLRTCLEELDSIGVELKDWSLGVVDFPCLAGGRQVCLCWQYGQDAIQYWHEVDADAAGRQPIGTLPTEGAYLPQAQAAAGPPTAGEGGVRKGAGGKLPRG